MGTDSSALTRRRAQWLWPTATAVVGFIVAALSMRLWEWRPGTPFGLTGDLTQVTMMLRDIHDHGWYWHNTDIGFPYGQNGSLFPELNVLHIAIIKVIGFFCTDYITPGVLFFVLGFPAAAAAFHLLARSQGIGPWGSMVGGVLFANAPGHQERFGHLYLAAYWVVPMAIWLVLLVTDGRLWHDSEGRPKSWAGRLAVVGAVVVVGLSGAYYVGFTALLVVVATVLRRSVGKPVDLLRGLVVVGGLGAVIAIPLAAAKWGARHELVVGRLPAERAFGESEIFAGKIMDLVLPWEGHRFDPAAYLTFVYKAGTTPTVEAAALGVVGTAGLVILVLAAFRLMFGARIEATIARWSALALATIAFYVVGGLGSFVALFITGQLRTWSRLTLYVLAFCLLAVGHVLSKLATRRPRVLVAVAIAVIVVGALDQTNPARAPAYAANRTLMATLADYTRDLRAATAPGCAVFQVPVLQYPESPPIGEMNGYDQLLPYLAGSDLKWSFGSMRGTPAGDWAMGIDTSDWHRLGTSLATAGFCAIEVDTKGIDPAVSDIGDLTSAFGPPVATSKDGQFVAFRTSSTPPTRADLGAPVLHPVFVQVMSYSPDVSSTGLVQPVGPSFGLSVVNLTGQPAKVDLTLTMTAVGDKDRTITLSEGEADLATARVSLSSTTEVAISLTVPPGRTIVSGALDGAPRRELGTGRLVSATINDVSARVNGHSAPTSLQQQRTGWVLP